MFRKTLSLGEIQSAFVAAIVSEREAPLNEFLPFIHQSPHGPNAIDRFQVYSDAWYIRLEESLREDYPCLHTTLGKKHWNQLISSYIRLCPSKSFTLAHAGDDLPEFLASHAEVSTVQPWLPDLAKLERAFYRLLATRDPLAWTPDELMLSSEDDAENICLKLQPGVQLLKTRWSVEQYLEEDLGPQPVSQQGLLVFRDAHDNLHPTAERLDDDEFHLLKMVASGITLAELIDAFDNDHWLQCLFKRASGGVVRVLAKQNG